MTTKEELIEAEAKALQLFYEIAIHGRQELPLAPDAYAGFTMALLRMIAFRPEQPGAGDNDRPAARVSIAAKTEVSAPANRTDWDWSAVVRGLELGGVAKQLAQKCAFVSFSDDILLLKITASSKHLAEKAYQDKLSEAVSEQLGKKNTLEA